MLSFLGMTIGFTHVMNTVTESAENVEVCVDVLIPGEALRNFTVILIPEEGRNLRNVCMRKMCRAPHMFFIKGIPLLH